MVDELFQIADIFEATPGNAIAMPSAFEAPPRPHSGGTRRPTAGCEQRIKPQPLIFGVKIA